MASAFPQFRECDEKNGVSLNLVGNSKHFHTLNANILRSTAAHELGHILGLRHNFAGSMAGTYSAKHEKQMTELYLKDFEVPKNHLPSSTVMDYQDLLGRSITGQTIKLSEQILSYDYHAIQALYKGKGYNNRTMPLHCTDAQKDSFIGCASYDIGPFPLVSAAVRFHKEFNAIPMGFVRHYTNALSPSVGQAKAIAQVRMSDYRFEENFIKDLRDLRKTLVSIFKPTTFDIRIRKDFPLVDFTLTDRIQRRQQEIWLNEIKENGGLNGFIMIMADGNLQQLKREALRIINTDGAFGLGEDGTELKLTSAQKAEIAEKADGFFSKFSETMSKIDYASLVLTDSVRGHLLEEELIKHYYIRLMHFMKTPSVSRNVEGLVQRVPSQKLLRKPIMQAQVRFRAPHYSATKRMLAIRLLKQKELTPKLASSYRSLAKRKLLEWSKEQLGGIDLHLVDAKKSSASVKTFVEEMRALLKSL